MSTMDYNSSMWANGNTYVQGDVVHPNNTAEPIFVCMASSSLNQHPTSNPSVWKKLGNVGIRSGQTQWSSSANYELGDIVKWGFHYYLCVANAPTTTTGQQPDLYPAVWSRLGGDLMPGGAFVMRYNFSTVTTDSDPGAGNIRLNNATQNAATILRLDLLDALGADMTSMIHTFDDSTSAMNGFIRIQHATDPSKWILFLAGNLFAPSGYRNQGIVPHAWSSANPFANGDPVYVAFDMKGDKGDTGAKGLNYRGNYSEIDEYAPNDVVSHEGSSFIALTTTFNAPYNGSPDWGVLALKGADA